MTFQVLRKSARTRRSTLANKETTPKLAEAVPVESEGISAFKVWHRIFFVRCGFYDVIASPTEFSTRSKIHFGKQRDNANVSCGRADGKRGS